jgi:tripartite ATP-independent transporter DctM subunit
MSQTVIGLLGIGILSAMLMIGLDVGFSMLVTGFIGFAMIGGWGAALANMAILPFDTLNNYFFAVLPLFILMGSFCAEGQIGRDAYEMARTWFGSARGGLAIATIGACGLFAAITGTTLAGSLVMGKVAYPEMRKAGYKMPLAAGVVSVGGTLGILIPPSMGFILIGMMTDLNVGELFMAGLVPGIIVCFFYMGTIVVWSKIDPKLAPLTPKTTWKQKFTSVRLTWPVVLLFLVIMGSIYTGVCTATEAGAIGAFGALIIPLARRQMSRKAFWNSLMDCARMTAMIIILMVGAYTFNAFMAITQIPTTFGDFLVGLSIPRWGIMFFILAFYLIAGTFFDPISILILTISIFYPAVQSLGFNLIWYSVIMVRLIEIGQISPPAGINLFGLKGVIDAPMSAIFKGVLPFLATDVLNLLLLCFFPVICTFLPNLMNY